MAYSRKDCPAQFVERGPLSSGKTLTTREAHRALTPTTVNILVGHGSAAIIGEMAKPSQ